MRSEGRDFVAAGHFREQFGEGNRCVVFVQWSDDLRTHRQALTRAESVKVNVS